jgi:hypothetical protein
MRLSLRGQSVQDGIPPKAGDQMDPRGKRSGQRGIKSVGMHTKKPLRKGLGDLLEHLHGQFGQGVPQKFAVFDERHNITKALLFDKLHDQAAEDLLGGKDAFASLVGLREHFAQVLMDKGNHLGIGVQHLGDRVVLGSVFVDHLEA